MSGPPACARRSCRSDGRRQRPRWRRPPRGPLGPRDHAYATISIANGPSAAASSNGSPVGREPAQRAAPRRRAAARATTSQMPAARQRRRRPARKRIAAATAGGSKISRASASRNRRRGAAEHQPRAGERQIELRMGEDLRQLDRSPRTPPARARSGAWSGRRARTRRRAPADEPGENRPAGREQQQRRAEQTPAPRRAAGPASGAVRRRATRRGISQAASDERHPGGNMQQLLAIMRIAQAERMRKRKRRRIASPIDGRREIAKPHAEHQRPRKSDPRRAAIDAALDAPRGALAAERETASAHPSGRSSARRKTPGRPPSRRPRAAPAAAATPRHRRATRPCWRNIPGCTAGRDKRRSTRPRRSGRGRARTSPAPAARSC